MRPLTKRQIRILNNAINECLLGFDVEKFIMIIDNIGTTVSMSADMKRAALEYVQAWKDLVIVKLQEQLDLTDRLRDFLSTSRPIKVSQFFREKTSYLSEGPAETVLDLLKDKHADLVQEIIAIRDRYDSFQNMNMPEAPSSPDLNTPDLFEQAVKNYRQYQRDLHRFNENKYKIGMALDTDWAILRERILETDTIQRFSQKNYVNMIAQAIKIAEEMAQKATMNVKLKNSKVKQYLHECSDFSKTLFEDEDHEERD